MIPLEQSRSRVKAREEGDLDNSTSVLSKFDLHLIIPVGAKLSISKYPLLFQNEGSLQLFRVRMFQSPMTIRQR